MANITKQKRDEMLAFLEQLKADHNDDASIRAFNEIQNHLTEKKFGLVFEEHTEEVDEKLLTHIPVLCADKDRRLCKDESKPWNFIIQGDNLQALYLLEKTHRGKVDCIYIDPPYNTGAKDWKYNNDYVDGQDVYRHSKWLSMMKSRLLLAKKLLNPKDSVLIVTIDEKEYLHLGCLLEELFPDCRIQMITSMTNKKGQPRSGIFSRCEEYIFVIYIGNAEIQRTSENMLYEIAKDNSNNQTLPTIWNSLLRRGTHSARQDRPKLFYPIIVDETTNTIHSVGDPLDINMKREDYAVPAGMVAAWPLHKDGSEGNWQMKPETLRAALLDGVAKIGRKDKKSGNWSFVYLKRKQLLQVKSGEIVCDGRDENGALILRYPSADEGGAALLQEPRSLWVKDTHDASVYGSTLIKGILKSRKFPFPKSLYAVQDTIRFFVSNKPNAVVVDFFAGSGTTMHAVNLLNAQDGGNRTCIMVTNNELSIEEEKELQKQGINKGDKEWEEHGIAKYVTWPRTACAINGVDVNGNALKGEYYGSNIPMSQGFECNVKFFECDWTPRKPEDYLLSNALCLHIREMIELQNHIEIDNKKYVLILNKSDFNKYVMDPEAYEQIGQIWVNQSIVLNSEELKLLRAKGFKYIPREYFGQELREAAE